MKRRLVGGSLLWLMTLALGLGACATAGDAPATPSLEKRLGGREGIAGVVDAFVATALARALDSKDVAAADREQVMKLVASLMNDIVEKR